MADLNRTPTTPSIRRSESRRSTTSGRQLHRLFSAQFIDDHALYHHEDDNDADGSENEDSVHESEDRRTGSREKPEESKSTLDDDTEDWEESEDDDSLNPGETVSEVRYGIPDERDVEALPPALEKKRSTRSIQDPNLVTWNGPDDPANPKNWSMKRKWAATLIVSAFTFVSPVSSSMISPALRSISHEFHITNQVESQLTLSIFILAFAIGPLFLGPLSETYGRVKVLQASNLFFLAWNLGCGFAQNKLQLMLFRFFSGLGGSAPLAIGGGLLSDCFHAEQRGRAISIYSLAPLLGPAVGPIAGGFISQNTTWRWCFWSTSIFTIVVQGFGVMFLQETYGPKLLKDKKNRLQKETGNMKLHTEHEHPDRTLTRELLKAFRRPFRLLFTQPIIIALALYMAYLYGLMYLMLSTFPPLWENVYGQATGMASLNFISMGLGFFLGTQICAPLNDKIYRRFKKQHNNVGKPEFRVPMMIPASLFVPIGLFWYGWSAQAKLHWIIPNIGACIFSAGVIVGFQCIQTYLVDSYTRFAASAIAAATVLRSLAGFVFPLFAPSMYEKLHYGWGNSVLGFIAIALGVPAPILLWKYGEMLRMKSKFAAN